jgi:hypothetical protein
MLSCPERLGCPYTCVLSPPLVSGGDGGIRVDAGSEDDCEPSVDAGSGKGTGAGTVVTMRAVMDSIIASKAKRAEQSLLARSFIEALVPDVVCASEISTPCSSLNFSKCR